MPGSVSNAVATTVMPKALCASFVEAREWSTEENAYPDGSSQRRARVAASRKRFQLTARLRASDLVALRDFYDARKGPIEPFYYYNLTENTIGTPVGSNYDASGTSTTGRYTVTFLGEWQQQMGLARGQASIELIETA